MATEKAIASSRLLWIDVLKGFAIILVVVGHQPEHIPEGVISFIYSFHMPLFFLLSGFIFSPKQQKIYMERSFKRLLIPFCFFAFVLALPWFVKWIIHLPAQGLSGLIKPVKIMIGGAVMAKKGWYTVFWFTAVLWLSCNLFNIIVSNHVSPLWLPALMLVAYLMMLLPAEMPFRVTVVPMAIAYIWCGFLINHLLQMVSIWKLSYCVLGG